VLQELPMSLCFQAPLPTGSLRLALPADAADAVAAALALDAHEGLVAALEQALQQPLDPRPVPNFGAEPPADPTLWADAGAGVRVGLPWSALAALSAAPRWPLRWPSLSFEVELAAFAQRPLPVEESAAADGVLLLPPAFQPPWRILLHDAEHGLVMDAEWRGPGSDIVCHAAPEPAAGARPPWRVVLAERFERPLAQWLGWEAAPPLSGGAAAALLGPAGPAMAASAGSFAPASESLYGLANAEHSARPSVTAAPFAHLLTGGPSAATAPGQPAAPSRLAGRIAPALDGAALWI
jgi:hypothetical protein